jgi:hypothetical protein
MSPKSAESRLGWFSAENATTKGLYSRHRDVEHVAGEDPVDEEAEHAIHGKAEDADR